MEKSSYRNMEKSNYQMEQSNYQNMQNSKCKINLIPISE